MSTRKEILEMLAAGDIDVNRATEMLGGLREPAEGSSPEPAPSAAPVPAEPVQLRSGDKPPRWLHIHVQDLASGKSRVRVNVPLGLLEFGLKLGSRFTDELNVQMMDDLTHALKSENLNGTLVEVEDLEDNERVHIYVD
jgi:hypothetical protein